MFNISFNNFGKHTEQRNQSEVIGDSEVFSFHKWCNLSRFEGRACQCCLYCSRGLITMSNVTSTNHQRYNTPEAWVTSSSSQKFQQLVFGHRVYSKHRLSSKITVIQCYLSETSSRVYPVPSPATVAIKSLAKLVSGYEEETTIFNLFTG